MAKLSIDPELARTPRQMKCPNCGERVISQEMSCGRVRIPRVQLSCLGLDCQWSIRVDLPADGPAQIVPDDKRTFSAAEHLAMSQRGPKPTCHIAGCKRVCEEGGLCHEHLVLWRASGEADRDAWIAAQATTTPGRKTVVRPPEEPADDDACLDDPDGLHHVGCGCDHSAPDDPDTNEPPQQEPPMPRRSNKPPCIVAGCDTRSQADDLCRKHHYRWDACGRPAGEQLAAWLAAGAPGKRVGRSSPTAPSPRKAKQPRSPKPSEGKAAPPALQTNPRPALAAITLQFDVPVTQIQLLRTGGYLSVFDGDGRFLQQVPA